MFRVHCNPFFAPTWTMGEIQAWKKSGTMRQLAHIHKINTDYTFIVSNIYHLDIWQGLTTQIHSIIHVLASSLLGIHLLGVSNLNHSIWEEGLLPHHFPDLKWSQWVLPIPFGSFCVSMGRWRFSRWENRIVVVIKPFSLLTAVLIYICTRLWLTVFMVDLDLTWLDDYAWYS